MATYKEMQARALRKYGFVPKTGWIAHVEGEAAPNRRHLSNQENPCPPDTRNAILECLLCSGPQLT